MKEELQKLVSDLTKEINSCRLDKELSSSYDRYSLFDTKVSELEKVRDKLVFILGKEYNNDKN